MAGACLRSLPAGLRGDAWAGGGCSGACGLVAAPVWHERFASKEPVCVTASCCVGR